MKDLLLNFSLEKLAALGPVDMLALIVMGLASIWLCLFIVGLISMGVAETWDGIKKTIP
jgi:hypothetical protein